MKGCGAGEPVSGIEGYVCNWKDKNWNKNKCPRWVNRGGNLSTEIGKLPVGLEKEDKTEIVH